MKPKFYRKVLKNGMTVILEKRDLPVVSVAFAVRNGGIHESLEEKGISHYIEHMLYKGTPTRNTQKIAEEIEKNGGELNGFTDEEITAYWCKMPSNHLNVALDVLSDMVKNPLFDKKELEKERKVIFEEIKMRKDRPPIYIEDRIMSCLYGDPLGKDLIGTHETMNAITREKIVKKFQEIYQPNNMILCVVGDAEFSDLIKFVEKNFGNGRGKVPKFKVTKKNKVVIEKRKGIDQVNLIFAFHTPLANDKKNHAAKVLSVLMGGGMSSRLFSEVREKRNLAYSVWAHSDIHKDYSYMRVYAGTTKDKMEKVKEIVLDEFKKVSESLTEKELEQTKEQIVGNYHISLEESMRQMVSLLLHEIEGNAKEFYAFEKNIKAVKLEDVKKLAKIDKYSFFALVPE